MKFLNARLAALLLAAMPFTSFSKTVDEGTARAAGYNYLKQKSVAGLQSQDDLTLAHVATSQIGGKSVAAYYVFNISGGTGFVMVSADDMVKPVLAWSKEASFDINNISPAARDWTNWYKSKITYAIENGLEPRAGVVAAWASVKLPGNLAAKTTSVAPLLATTWDQSPNYNALCPGSGSSKAVTGCVATAMAQVMKFWNWPSVGTGMHSYTDDNYGFRSANFGTTTYQWTSMPNSISSGNTPIATLMSHCGVSTNMDYETAAAGGSGTVLVAPYSNSINSAEYALKTYFQYKSTMKSILREGMAAAVPFPDYTDAAWNAALRTELDAGRPILYRGNGASGGHAWVCDGYESSDNTFHFNWGWGGSGPNGYYLTDDLAPPVLGAGGGGGDFNMSQAAIIQIQPDTYPTFTDNIKMKQPVNYSTSIPVKFGAPFSFGTKLLNSRTTTFTGDISAQVYDMSNNYVTTIQTYTGQTISAGDSTATLNFATTTGIDRLVSARYAVRLMYRNTGVTTWSPVGNNGTIYNYGILDIKNDTGLRLFDTIKITAGLPLTPGSAASIFVRVFNRDDAEFTGNLKAQLVNVNTGTVYSFGTASGLSVPEYSVDTRTISTTSISAPSGMYALEILHQYTASGNFFTTGSKDYPNPILVKVGTGADVKVLNAGPQDILIYPNPAAEVVTALLNENRVTEIIVTDMAGKVIKQQATDPNASAARIEVGGLAAGVYLAQFVTEQGTITRKINVAK